MTGSPKECAGTWSGLVLKCNTQLECTISLLPEAETQLCILQDFGKNPVLNVLPRSPKHEGNGLWEL